MNRTNSRKHQTPLRRIVTLVGFGAVLLGSVEAARAQASTKALLVVLDVSGSMKEPVEGGVKSDLATRCVFRTLSRLPANTHVGLRLLGDGSDDECAASRLALPFATFEQDRWGNAFERVPWNGATPLTYTLRQALADLEIVQATDKEMLVVGDGEETCGEDPVAIARAEANGIRIHTISLGMQISHQLAGIALVTGGQYRTAFDEESFEAAIEEALPEGLPEAATGTVSATPAVVELILDVSNSMWGQIDGRVKMDWLARPS